MTTEIEAAMRLVVGAAMLASVTLGLLVLAGIQQISARRAAPEAPQGPTPPATFPLTTQGAPEGAEQP